MPHKLWRMRDRQAQETLITTAGVFLAPKTLLKNQRALSFFAVVIILSCCYYSFIVVVVVVVVVVHMFVILAWTVVLA